VLGVDGSAAMLEQASVAVPGAEFRVADLCGLPLPPASVDLVVCALALTHFEDLAPPIAELARVLRVGGRMVLSDFPPILSALGGTAFFVGGDGRAGYVHSHAHTHAAYLEAFRAADLEVVRCVEPAIGAREVVLMSAGMASVAEEAFGAALIGIPGALVWELRKGASRR
jgi:ubiquinone/menaquinone biosynthesis C-methylase UbiE